MVLAQLVQGFSLIADQFYPGHKFPETVDEAVERWGNVMLQYYGTMSLPVPGGGPLLQTAIETFKAQLRAGIVSYSLKLNPVFNTLHQNMAASVLAAGWSTVIPYQLGVDELLLKPDGYEGTSAQVVAAISAAIDARTHATTSTLLTPPFTTVTWA